MVSVNKKGKNITDTKILVQRGPPGVLFDLYKYSQLM